MHLLVASCKVLLSKNNLLVYNLVSALFKIQVFHTDSLVKTDGGTSSGFWHGRTGQLPGAAFFHDTWGAARAVKKKNYNPLRRRKAVFIIYHFTVWRIGKLAPLLAEKVQCTEAV